MIPNKFLCYLTEEAFNNDLEQGTINEKSIVFVLETGFIYSHGTYFYCNFSPEVEKVISTSITNLSQALDESNKVISEALCDIKSRMLDKKDFNLEEINTDLENKRQEIVDEVTSLSQNINQDLTNMKDSINEDLTTIKEETIQEVESFKHLLGDSEELSAQTLTDLDRRLSETNITVGHAINELRSQISDLKNKLENGQEL